MNCGEVIVRFGRAQFVWLNTLLAWMRSSGRTRPTWNDRNRPMSTFHTDGLRNWLRRLLPKPVVRFTPVGCEKSDGSYQGSVGEPAVPVGLGSPCTSMLIAPHPGQLTAGF